MYRERASRIAGAVLWHVDAAETRPRPVLPDGCMDLLWCDGVTLVAGPDTHAFMPAPKMRRAVTGLRFAPGFAPAVLGLPAHELRDSRVRLDQLWTPATLRQLGNADDPALFLEEIAFARLRHHAGPDRLMAEVAARVRRGEPVARIAAETHLSARQLRRRSHAAFGYGPKTLDRVLRMNRALDLVGAGAPAVRAALLAGYADQAHLARETKSLTGSSVTDLTT